MNINEIPFELIGVRQWVCWDEKKIPRQPNGEFASVNDPATWSTFDECVQAAGKFNGVGYVFTKDDPFTGVDLDKCIDDDGALNDFAESMLIRLNSYSELSPSGRGVHIIVKGKLPNGAKKQKGLELYDSGRYFTMTGNRFGDAPTDIKDRQNEINALVASIDPKPEPKPEPKAPVKPADKTDYERAREVLRGLSATRCDEYAEWLQVGQALHHEDSNFLDLWEEWSRGSSKYKAGECAKKWKGFGRQGSNPVTFGTIVALARQDSGNPELGKNHEPPLGTYTCSAAAPKPTLPTGDDGLPVSLKPTTLAAFNIAEDASTLLGKRWICEGGSCLWIGSTGFGKSSSTMQAAVSWALGRDFFGVKPKRPLKSLFIQAENDTGDVAEAYQGISHGLDITDHPELDKMIDIYRECSQTGRNFIVLLEKLIAKDRPDLVWIDCLFAYLGGDVCDQGATSEFLRNWLNPLAHKYKCALMVVHHTTKPPADPSEKSKRDLSYLGAGTAELANWARAVVTITSMKDSDAFVMTAAKRGSRAGFTTHDAEDSPRTEQLYLKHSSDGRIFWQRAERVQAVEDKVAEGQYATVIDRMKNDSIKYSELALIVASVFGIQERWAKNKISRMINEKMIVSTGTKGVYRASK